MNCCHLDPIWNLDFDASMSGTTCDCVHDNNHILIILLYGLRHNNHTLILFVSEYHMDQFST